MNLKKQCSHVIIASSIITPFIINTEFANADTEFVNIIEDNYDQNINIQQRNNTVGIVNSCDYLNVRIGASTKHSVITTVNSGEAVTILENDSNGWMKIQKSDGNQGWVNGKYISINQNEPVEDESEKNTESESEENTIDQKINDIIYVANLQMGKPYIWGAEGPNSFDCSGFTYYIYKNGANITLPRVSRSQASAGVKVDRKDLKAGDLVFFNTSGSGISHVGMYIGDGQFIHASTNQKKVRTDSINSSYYSSKFVTARRIIN